MRTARLLSIGALSAALILPTAVAAQSPAGGVFTATVNPKDYVQALTVPLTVGKTNMPSGKTIGGYIVSLDGGAAPTTGSDPRWRELPTQIKLATGATDGVHTIYAWAKAKPGLVISARGSGTTFLDRVDPVAVVTSTNPAQGVTPPPVATSRNVSVTFTYSDPGEGAVPATGSGVAKYAVVNGTTAPVPGAPDWKAVPNATGPVTASVTLPTGNGVKSVSVFVRDRAGNPSSAATVQFNLLITGPTVTIVAANGADYTKSNKPGVKVVAKVGTTVLQDATFIVKVTATNSQPAAPTLSSSWKTAVSSVTLASPGTWYLWAWAKNSNNTISAAPGTDSITYDNVKPTASLAFVDGLGDPITTTTSRVVNIDASHADDVSGVTKWALVNGTTVPATSAFKVLASFPLPSTYTLPFGDGSKTVSLFVMDAAGNISNAASDTVTMDLAAPTVTVDITATNAYKNGSNNWFTKNLGVAVDIDWVDNAGIGKDGAQYKLNLTGVTPTSWSLAATSITLADQADGLQTIHAFVKDKNGSIGHGTVQIFLDRTAPTVTLTVINNNTANPSFTVTPGVDAASGNDKVALVVGTTPPAANSSAWVTSGGSVALSVGTQTVTAFARDHAGNVSTVNAGNSKSVTVTP